MHAIGNGVAAILASGLDPARLFADAAATAATVEEILRFDPPLHLFTRYALEDAEAFGHRFRRGDTVGCLLAAAEPRPGALPATRTASTPRAPPAPHLVLRRRHPLLRRRAARARRARDRAADPLRAAARARARGTAGLRRPLPLPRADRRCASARPADSHDSNGE